MKLLPSKSALVIMLVALAVIPGLLAACATKNAEDTAEPYVATEASIPEAAEAPIETVSAEVVSESDSSFDSEVAPGVEVIVVEDLKDQDPQDSGQELPILKNSEAQDPKPKPKPQREPDEKSIEGSWFLIAEVKNDKLYSVFVDGDSIKKTGEGVESLSKLVFEYTQNDEDGLSYNEVHIQSSINCQEKTYAYNSSKFYNAIGQLVYHEDIAYNKKPIEPGDLSAQIADFVCSNDLNNSGG